MREEGIWNPEAASQPGQPRETLSQKQRTVTTERAEWSTQNLLQVSGELCVLRSEGWREDVPGSVLNEAVAQVQLPQWGHPLDGLSRRERGNCGQPITHSFPSCFLWESTWKTVAEEAVEASREMLFRSNGPIQGQILAGAAAKMRIGGQFPSLLCPCTLCLLQGRAEPHQRYDYYRWPQSLSQPALSHAVGQPGPWHQEAILMFWEWVLAHSPQQQQQQKLLTAQTKSIKSTMHPSSSKHANIPVAIVEMKLLILEHLKSKPQVKIVSLQLNSTPSARWIRDVCSGVASGVKWLQCSLGGDHGMLPCRTGHSFSRCQCMLF